MTRGHGMTPDAYALLQALADEQVPTMTGRPNRILEVGREARTGFTLVEDIQPCPVNGGSAGYCSIQDVTRRLPRRARSQDCGGWS